MKNYKPIIVMFLCTLLSIHQSLGQELEPSIDPSKQEYYDFYISKQKKLKKTGYILLGAGLASFAAGYAVAYNASLDDMASGMILLTGGILATGASIPVFIIAGSNKRKAKALIQTGRYQMMDLNYNSPRYVAIGLKIDF